MTDLQPIIETAYESRSNLSPQSKEPRLRDAINQTLAALEEGTLRVAELTNGQWKVNQWIKKAVLLYFSLHKSAPIDGHFTQFYDKVPLRFGDASP